VKHLFGATVFAVLCSFALSTSGQANTVILVHAGQWEAFGGKANDDSPVCGIANRGAEGRIFTVKWFYGADHLTIQVFKNGWSIPAGTPVDVYMKIDRAAPWTANTNPR